MKKFIVFVLIFILFFQSHETFSQHYKIKNKIMHSSITGLVKTIYNADISINGSTSKEKAQNYLKANYGTFGFKEDISDLILTKSQKSHSIEHLFFKQYYRGLEVINSGIVISINKENKISMVYSDYFPIHNLTTIASINVYEAESIAKKYYGNYLEKDIESKSEIKVYVDDNGVPRLVYKVELNLEGSITIGVMLIDCHSGKILETRNAASSYLTGKGKVFDPDPGTYLRDSTLIASSNVDDAYKTNIDLTNLNGDGYIKGKYAKSIDYYGTW